MNIVIIKYNAGNIMSVDYALQRLGIEANVTDDHDAILAADKVIFPGVGEASTTMRYLKERNLHTLIPGLKQPLLGICLGMQLMCRFSEEGDTECMGIYNEDIKKFSPAAGDMEKLKVPHMGWNTLDGLKSDLFRNVPVHEFVYFVHSYYATLGPDTIAACHYMHPFSAALHRDNFYATQFHPEKSGAAGSQILKNFLEL